MPADPQAPRRDVAEASGFSLHAGVVAQGAEGDKIEHLGEIYCAASDRHRAAVADREQARALCVEDAVIFEPEDFIARLAALVPKPRAHLTRYHGVFAPASPDRARIVPKTPRRRYQRARRGIRSARVAATSFET